jgi:signal transduction histidine kinase
VVEPGHDRVNVRVSDEGPGIAPDRVPYLFQPFSVLDPQPSTNSTGLGLYISRAIVEAHGGQISVNCAEGGGTTFEVTFPLAAVSEPGERGLEPAAVGRLGML